MRFVILTVLKFQNERRITIYRICLWFFFFNLLLNFYFLMVTAAPKYYILIISNSSKCTLFLYVSYLLNDIWFKVLNLFLLSYKILHANLFLGNKIRQKFFMLFHYLFLHWGFQRWAKIYFYFWIQWSSVSNFLLCKIAANFARSNMNIW